MRPLKIMNIMLGQKRGGIEHVFVDYTHALQLLGHEVISVVHPKAQVRNQLTGQILPLPNWNAWDFFAALRLRGAIARLNVDLIITHGNRALCLAHLARRSIPLLAVAHNYRYKHLSKATALAAITKTMALDIASKMPDSFPVYTLYNPIVLEKDAVVSTHFSLKNPPVLGFLGRLVPKKGGALFLHALALLKDQGVAFKAVLAGDGPERKNLEHLTQELGLEEEVTFLGWVSNPEHFFEHIDLFVIPSLEEPFGVVVLEGWKYGKPILATRVGGPAELINDQKTGILVNPNDPDALTQGIAHALKNPDYLKNLSQAGHQRVEDFSLEAFSMNLGKILTSLLKPESIPL